MDSKYPLAFQCSDGNLLPVNSRAKGARCEREWAKFLRDHGFNARRGQQFSGSPDSPDVVSDLSFHFEVKAVEHGNVHAWMQQAMLDCGTTPPVVAHKKNRTGWLVTMRAEDWIQLCEKLYSS